MTYQSPRLPSEPPRCYSVPPGHGVAGANGLRRESLRGPSENTRSGWGAVPRHDACANLATFRTGQQSEHEKEQKTFVLLGEESQVLREVFATTRVASEKLEAANEALRKRVQAEVQRQHALREEADRLQGELERVTARSTELDSTCKQLVGAIAQAEQTRERIPEAPRRILERVRALEAEVRASRERAATVEQGAVAAASPALVELQSLLPRLALGMQCRKDRDFRIDDARQQLQDEAPELLPALEKTFAAALRGDCMLLLTHDVVEGVPRFRFTHPSFQEYFAACHAAHCLRQGLPSTLPPLSEILFDRNWRKFISFFLALPELQIDITLESRGLGNAEARTLAGFLRPGSAVRRLNLRENRIGSEGARYLAEALVSNPPLRYLDLSFNKLGDDAAGFLASAMEKNTNLQALHLAFNRIGDDGGTRLTESLRYNSTLKTVALWKNNCSKEILRSIETELNREGRPEDSLPRVSLTSSPVPRRSSRRCSNLTTTASLE